MTRRAFLAGAIGALHAIENPPNIVLITADNLGYGDLRCYGNREVISPNLDRLASQGVRHTQFYTASPTCTVSRACLLTGRYPRRHGLNHQLNLQENIAGIGLPHSEKLMPRYLKRAGYATACVGKWNLGWARGSRPTERGFDEFYGHRSGNMNYYTHTYNGHHDLYRGVEEARDEGYSTDLFANEACRILRSNAKKRFFLYLAFNAVHYPNPKDLAPGEKLEWQVPARYLEQYGWKADEPDQRRRYKAAITALDDGVGRVLKQVDDLRLTPNTLVVFYSDNGAFMLKDRGLEVASNKPLREGGVTLWEGGIRVPFLARWPGVIPKGSKCREPLISYDLLPLFAGSHIDRPVDGKDPAAVLAGKARSPHAALYFEYAKYQAIRKGRYKLIRQIDQPWQLFDLDRDLSESRDLASSHPSIVSDLKSDFERWRASTVCEPCAR